MAVVGAHHLDPEAPRGVTHHVEREGAATAELEAPVDGEDQQRHADVPERLIGEGRVVEAGQQLRVAVDIPQRLARVRRVHPVHLETPRQRRHGAVQLVVEPVAEAPDGLRQGQPGSDGIGDHRQRDAELPAGQPGPDRATGDRAPDAEPALPDLQGVERVLPGAEVVLVRGGHVVDPCPDDAEGHRPHGDVEDRAGRHATTAQPHLGHHRGDHDPGDDAEGVRAQRHRPELPDGGVGARDGGQGTQRSEGHPDTLPPTRGDRTPRCDRHGTALRRGRGDLDRAGISVRGGGWPGGCRR